MYFFCGRGDRGALAGNGKEMAVIELGSKKKEVTGTTENSPGRKPGSRKSGKGKKRVRIWGKGREAEAQKGAEETCADGKEVLKKAAHRAAIKQSTAIATRLAEQAAQGNPTSAKMLVLLMDGKLHVSTRKPGELTYAQQLALDPPWEGNLDEVGDSDEDEDQDEWTKEMGEGGVERE